ncbi:ATP-binding protein [Streptomyces cinereospinus]
MLLLPATLMAAATGTAVALVSPSARAAVALCGALATLLVTATAAEAVRRGRALRDAQAGHARHSAELEQRIADHHEDWARFGEEILPTALRRMAGGVSAPEVIRKLGLVNPVFRDLPDPQRQLLKKLMRIVDHEEALRESAASSFVTVARRVQAIVHQQANELREMEEDHGRNPEVFDDLLRIDHGNALIGRLADSLSVLGGGRPGRQWPLPVSLYSTLRGAMSRILEYRRIKLDNIARISVKGIYVEPVIHACAELFDNATRYSPPSTEVHVTAVRVQTGLAIEIEDAGVSFSEEARARIEGMLERAMAGVDLQDIAGPPRLGLAVVGRLCRAYNMQVALRSSAYGGVRAVVIVPSNMLTDEPGVGLAHGIGATSVPNVSPDALEGPKRPPKRRRPTSPKIPGSVSMEDDVPVVKEWNANGLPQRRTRMKIPITQRIREQYAAERAEKEAAEREGREPRPLWGTPMPEPEPEDQPPPGMWVEAFMEGLKRPKPASSTQPADEPARAARADDERDPH